jgi:diacylglycerol kinase (ATP)
MPQIPPSKTLVILNPHAAGGQALKVWPLIDSRLQPSFGKIDLVVTQRPEDVAVHVERALAEQIPNVISIGGDGTNHALINELVRLRSSNGDLPAMTYGCLPIGTGRDWARTLGIPLAPEAAADWLGTTTAVSTDIGAMQLDDQPTHYFLNIASMGASGKVSARVNLVRQRMPWTFLQNTVTTLLTFQPPKVRVLLDGQEWYSGGAYLVVVANGRYFGHNMMIAPSAVIDDGFFEVVVVEAMPRLRVIGALNTAYSGQHVRRSDVHVGKARVVEIESESPLSYEMDGEPVIGTHARFELLPGKLEMFRKVRQADE